MRTDAAPPMVVWYRIEGHDIDPRVAVRCEDDGWHASIFVVDGTPSHDVTARRDTAAQALAEAEALLVRRYPGARLRRSISV